METVVEQIPGRILRKPASPLWRVPCLLLLAGLACLAIDIPIAGYFKSDEAHRVVDGPIRESLNISEAFGHGFGVTLILIAVAILDPGKQKQMHWFWAVMGPLGSGLTANLIKASLTRIRPTHFEFGDGRVWDTFVHVTGRGSPYQSFPSGHTATAFGLAMILSSLYPRGRVYFLILAILVGMQRIVASAHYPSDVCAGATIGWLVGSLCVKLSRENNAGSDS